MPTGVVRILSHDGGISTHKSLPSGRDLDDDVSKKKKMQLKNTPGDTLYYIGLRFAFYNFFRLLTEFLSWQLSVVRSCPRRDGINVVLGNGCLATRRP